MKYSKEKIAEICGHVEKGLSFKDSAILSHITEETFYQWKNNKPEFSESLKNAESKFKETLLDTIKKASHESWQAAAWLLERKYHEEFGQRTKSEVQIKNEETATEYKARQKRVSKFLDQFTKTKNVKVAK